MTDGNKDKPEKSLTEIVEWIIKSLKEEGPDIIEKLQESAVGPDLATIFQQAGRVKTDTQTYVSVIKFLQSEIERGAVRIIAYSIGNRNFNFFLQEKEPFKVTKEGNIGGTGTSLERFRQIVNAEVFNVLHYVYQGQYEAYLQDVRARGGSNEDGITKFEATSTLLTPDLQQGIILARTETARTLIYTTYDLMVRNPRPGEPHEPLRSVLVKLLLRDNLLADAVSPWDTVTFECTIADLKALIKDIEAIIKNADQESVAT